MQPVLVGFIVYLVIVLCAGFYTVRLTRDLKDFALGGQRLGPWVIAFSERASGESAWLIIGLPGAALVAGLLELWTVVGCVGGIIFSWYVIAHRLRIATAKTNALTLPELLATRYQDERGFLRLIASLIITFFFTFYVAAQFSGAGKVLNVTFGLTEMQGMLLGVVIIVFYTLMGGFYAVAWTDLIQGIIMIGTLVILPLVGWLELSGSETSAPIMDWSTLWGGQTGWAAAAGAIGGLSWGLGYMGQPHLVTRYMAINKPENVAVSRRIAIAWAVPAFLGSMFIGLVGLQLLQQGVLSLNGSSLNSISALPDPEKLMPIMTTYLMNPWVAGIFISGAIAAMMSTADSQLLVSTSVLTEDIFKRFFHRVIGGMQLLTLSRLLTLVIGFVAFLLAWTSRDLVFETVSYAWGGLGASFGPVLLLTLWWRKTSRVGVMAGMIAGTFFTVIPVFSHTITPRFTAFLLAFVAVILGSFLRPDTSNMMEEMTEAD